MAVRVTRLGSPRAPEEGVRLGTVRRPPRGVRKADYSRRNYFDLWFPQLAPSAKLVRWALAEPFTNQRWITYVRHYRREMHVPSRQRVLQLLARLSHQANFSVGCYCEREDRCHRSILRELLAEHGAEIATDKKTPASSRTRPGTRGQMATSGGVSAGRVSRKGVDRTSDAIRGRAMNRVSRRGR